MRQILGFLLLFFFFCEIILAENKYCNEETEDYTGGTSCKCDIIYPDYSDEIVKMVSCF